MLSIGETLCYTRVLSSGCHLADIVNILGETCVLNWMYFLDGFVDGNLVESAHHFLDFGCHNGFCEFCLWFCSLRLALSFRRVRSVAVFDGCHFRFLFDVFCITAFYEAGSSLMPSVWLSAGVVTFAVG